MSEQLQPLDAAERATLVEVMEEMERRKLQWPCFACRLAALSGDVPREACSHVELVGATTYESELRRFYAAKGLTADPGARAHDKAIEP